MDGDRWAYEAPSTSLPVRRGARRKLECLGAAHLGAGLGTTVEFDAKPLIEKNAIKIAALEREWAVLGPLRPITFSVYLDVEEEARSFADCVRQEGFDVSFSQEMYGNGWRVHASLAIEPTAQNITSWEEWFHARADAWPIAEEEGRYARFEGWSYPTKLAPTFSMEGRKRSAMAEKQRAQILFGSTLCQDPAPKGKYEAFPRPDAKQPPFRLNPSEFLGKARDRRPAHPEPTASHFAQWLYSLYADAFGDAQDREEGKAAEEHILAQRRAAYSSTNHSLLKSSFPEWRLVHNGLQASHGKELGFFAIDHLRVRGEPMRVLPDLVYVQERTGNMIIVEIKHSRMSIPSNLWPNVWGQLWCYSQMEQARKAPNLTVIGEVWGDAWTRSGDRLVCLRASVRRDPRVSAYDRFFRALFDIYRGDDDA